MIKICLDPGHGGKDGGGGTNKYFKEKELVLRISKYQEQRLEELGFEVYMTRTRDVSMKPNERILRVRNSKSDICISNHINAGGGDGAEVIRSIYNNTELPALIGEKLKSKGQNVRRIFTRSYNSDSSIDYYYMVRETGNSHKNLIVEYGFADSPGDDVEQLRNNWESYAEAVVEALCIYFDVPYEEKRVYNCEPWKTGFMMWLKDNGYIFDKHDPEDKISYWELGSILKNFKEDLK